MDILPAVFHIWLLCLLACSRPIRAGKSSAKDDLSSAIGAEKGCSMQLLQQHVRITDPGHAVATYTGKASSVRFNFGGGGVTSPLILQNRTAARLAWPSHSQ